jgi:septal ring factor EnvC (AmiA/AmiB activator)
MVFTTEQLTWVVVGACTLGGSGYLTVNSAISQLDKNISIANTTLNNQNQKLEILQAQLNRLEEKMDQLNKNK